MMLLRQYLLLAFLSIGTMGVVCAPGFAQQAPGKAWGDAAIVKAGAAKPAPAAKAAAPVPPSQTPAASVETGALPAAAARQPVASGDWFLDCTGDTAKPICSLRQVVADDRKRRIIELRATAVGKTAFLELTVPIGISIPYGVSLEVAEGKKIQAQLVDCSQTGCRAVLPLDTANLAAIRTAKTLAVTFQDSKSGKVISISGSPKGFDAGIGKVTAAG